MISKTLVDEADRVSDTSTASVASETDITNA